MNHVPRVSGIVGGSKRWRVFPDLRRFQAVAAVSDGSPGMGFCYRPKRRKVWKKYGG